MRIAAYSGSHFSYRDDSGVLKHVKEPTEEQLGLLQKLCDLMKLPISFQGQPDYDPQYDVHSLWHSRPQYDLDTSGYAYMQAMDRWADAHKEQVRCFNVDDCAFCSARMYLIPSMSKWSHMGITVLYVTQHSAPVQFFCYPGHLAALLAAFTDISTILHSVPSVDRASPRYLEKKGVEEQLLKTVSNETSDSSTEPQTPGSASDEPPSTII